VSRQKRHSRLPATDAEYQHFSEQFVDAVLDPRQPWLVQYILANGFPPVPTKWQLSSGVLAVKMHDAIEQGFFVEEWLHAALMKPDRQKLVDWFQETAKERELTADELSRLLACADFKTLKNSLKALSGPFRFRPGPTPPSKRQFDEALNQAKFLRPALLMLLNQQSMGTKNTTEEILKYLAKDFPEGCAFLIGHISKLEQCLKDQSLLKKAKTRPLARAGVLADAMAGSIHLDREFSTAIEYLRAERRRRLKSSL
jgi:hypothetical protein